MDGVEIKGAVGLLVRILPFRMAVQLSPAAMYGARGARATISASHTSPSSCTSGWILESRIMPRIEPVRSPRDVSQTAHDRNPQALQVAFIDDLSAVDPIPLHGSRSDLRLICSPAVIDRNADRGLIP